MRRRGFVQSNTRRRPNPGQSRLRQQMAPQPDQAQPFGARPMDAMRRSLPSPQMFNAQANPMAAPEKAGGQAGGVRKPGPGKPPPVPQNPVYGQFTDFLSPKDKPMGKGLTDQQVQWIKANLLGRQGGGNEGMPFQNQLASYIKNAGGMEPFMQMLGQMPGWQKRQVVPGGTPRMSANTFRPGETRDGRQRSGDQVGGIRSPKPVPAPTPSPAPIPTPQQPVPQQQPMLKTRHMAPQQTQGTMDAPLAQPQRQQQAAQPQGQQMAAGHAGAQRAGQAHYGGEKDRERQKAKDREFFGKRGVALTPELEEGMRNLTDQYLAALVDIGYSEADAAAQLAQEKERLATDYGSNLADLEEQQAGLGMLNSGQQTMAREQLNTQTGRGFQDLAMNAAQQQRAIANAKAALLEALRSGRMDLNLDATMQSVLDSYGGGYAGLPTGGGKRRRNA